jgi:hypothetical protein
MFPSFPPGKWRDGFLNKATTASFRILAMEFFVKDPVIGRCMLWAIECLIKYSQA